MSICKSSFVSVRCTSCSPSIDFPHQLWLVVDADERPDLWLMCVQDMLRKAVCPQGHTTNFEAPLLIHSYEHRMALFSYGRDGHLGDPKLLSSLIHSLRASLRETGLSIDHTNTVQVCDYNALLALMDSPETFTAMKEDNQSVEKIMHLIDAPFADYEMPQRISIIREGLTTFTKRSNPSTWAWLNERLASSLMRNPHGERHDNVEAAIQALWQAATVYTEDFSPVRYADTQMNLALCYFQREGGDSRGNLSAARDAASNAAKVYGPASPDLFERASDLVAQANSMLLSTQRNKETAQPSYANQQASSSLAEEEMTEEEQGRQGPDAQPNSLSDLMLKFQQLPFPESPGDYSRAIHTYQRVLGEIQYAPFSVEHSALLYNYSAYLRMDTSGAPGQGTLRALEVLRTALQCRSTAAIRVQILTSAADILLLSPIGIRTNNLHDGLSYLEEALAIAETEEVRADAAHLYASASNDLHDYGEGEVDEMTLAHLTAAAEVFTQKTDPVRWGHIRHEYARTCRNLIKSTRLTGTVNQKWVVEGLDAARGALHIAERRGLKQLYAKASLVLADLLTSVDGLSEAEAAERIYVETADQTTPGSELWLSAKQGLRSFYEFGGLGQHSANLHAAIKITRELIESDVWSVPSISQFRDLRHLGSLLVQVSNGNKGVLLEAAMAFKECLLAADGLSVLPQDLGLLHLEFGTCLVELGERLDEAVSQYELAVQHLSAAGLGLNWNTAVLMLVQAYSHRRSADDVKKAKQVLEDAVSAADPEVLNVGALHVLLAELLLEHYANETLSAKHHLLRGVELFPDWWHIERARALLTLGRAHFIDCEWQQAYDVLRRSLREANTELRARKSQVERKLITDLTGDVGGLLVECCLKLGQTLEAFLTSEEARSRRLWARMALCRTLPPAGVPAELLTREEELLTQLREAYGTETPTHGNESPSTWYTTVQRAELALSELWETMRVNYKAHDYAAMRLGMPARWEHINGWLNAEGPEFGVVSFFKTDQRWIAFILRTIWKEPKLIELQVSDAHVTIVQEMLRSGVERYRSGERPSIEKGFVDLARHLLYPILDLLSDVERLVLVPYGQLHNFPLHALPLNGSVLAATFATSYAPSVSAALRCYSSAKSYNAVSTITGVVIGDSLGDLPGARVEAMEVAERLNTAPILGNDATRDRVIKNLQSDVYCAHFALHGIYDPEDPSKSGVVLSGGDVLTATDLSRVPGLPRLIVLSACETGLQKLLSGDELEGLPGVLMMSGVATVLASLWPVSDDVAKQFMSRFYEKLFRSGASNGNVASAMQQVLSDLRTDYSHALDWAPFVVYGHAGALYH